MRWPAAAHRFLDYAETDTRTRLWLLALKADPRCIDRLGHRWSMARRGLRVRQTPYVLVGAGAGSSGTVGIRSAHALAGRRGTRTLSRIKCEVSLI